MTGNGKTNLGRELFLLYSPGNAVVAGRVFLGYELAIVGPSREPADSRMVKLVAQGFEAHKKEYGAPPQRVIVSERKDFYRVTSSDPENRLSSDIPF
ncbi:MAG: hypothetical protein ABH864_04580 [archaeon]